MSTHHLECRCGAVRGEVETGLPVNRVLCYCADCQGYARFLGRADEILDDRGGSDVIQTLPRAVTITAGAEHLAAVRMTPGGPLRWYAACCKTPIGNTPASPQASFVGLLSTCLEKDGRSLDADFGPVRMWGFTASAIGEPKPAATPLWRFIVKLGGMMLKARLDGGWRRTPFFDVTSGRPVAEPRTLTEAERAALVAAPA